MSVRFVLAVLLMTASLAALYALGRGEWNLHLEQRQALSRTLPPGYYDDYVRPTGTVVSLPS
jgi:hypothetical protein